MISQEFEQVRLAVHPAEAGIASASRQAMNEKAMTVERAETFMESPFLIGRRTVFHYLYAKILRLV
jgi:hypothetical protein